MIFRNTILKMQLKIQAATELRAVQVYAPLNDQNLHFLGR